MAGKALASFADFVAVTNERQLTPSTEMINDAVKNTYTLRDALKGRGFDEVIQSGATITDRIQLTAGTQFGFYKPNDQFSPIIEDTVTKQICPWRFAKDLWSWTDQELELNEGDRFVMFKKLRDTKKQASYVSMFNGLEDAVWATPDYASMEATGEQVSQRPYSIPAFITETGLTAWEASSHNLMQVSTATNAKWRNQIVNYQAADPDGTLVSAFEESWLRLKFEAPDTKEQYFKETKFSKMKIYAPLDGRKMATRLLRQTNDRNYPTNDLGYAVEDPTFGNIPIKWAQPLDSAGYTTGQPRFFWVNLEFLVPVFHAKRYFYQTDPINGGHTQPFSWVVYCDIWYNWFCRSRYRQGIVVPV